LHIDNIDIYPGKSGQWKNAFVTPEQAMTTATAEQYPAAHLYVDYIPQLKSYNAVDLDDLILLARCCYPATSGHFWKSGKTRYRYLLVE